MRKTLVLAVVAGLVVSLVGPAEAAKKKKKPKPPAAPVAVDQKFFLRDTSCDDPNYLSLEDGPDNSCWYVDTGPAYDVFETAGLLPRDTLSQIWEASDGLPLTLDVSKPITGEITTAGGSCLGDPVPECSPVAISIGQATLDVVVLGIVNGQETELGTFTESYVVTPGATHTAMIEMPLDAALANAEVATLTVKTYLHGAAVGHGTIELEEPASFVTVPAFVTPAAV